VPPGFAHVAGFRGIVVRSRTSTIQLLLPDGGLPDHFEDRDVREMQGVTRSNEPSVLRAKAAAGGALAEQGDFAKAVQYLTQVLESQQDLLGEDHLDACATRRLLKRVHEDAGDLSAARKVAEAIARQRLRRKQVLEQCDYKIGQAGDMEECNRERAEVLLGEVVRDRKRLLGADHKETLVAVHRHGSVLWELGRYAEAEELWREAVDGCARNLGPEHPTTLVSKGDLAAAVHSRGDIQGAIVIYQDVLEAKERVMGRDHAETHKTRANIGTSLHTLRKFQEAREMEEEAAAGLDATLGPSDRSTLMVKQNLAATLRELGELDRALLVQREVLAHQKDLLGEAHPDVAITKFQLAQTLEYLQQRGTPAVLETDVADETKLNDEKKKLENTYKMGMTPLSSSLKEPYRWPKGHGFAAAPEPAAAPEAQEPAPEGQEAAPQQDRPDWHKNWDSFMWTAGSNGAARTASPPRTQRCPWLRL